MSEHQGLRIEAITDRARIPLSRDEWNALCAHNETNTVFQTYEWFDAWWRAFGAQHELFLLLLRRGDRIVGFAPFMIRRVLPGMAQLQFVGAGNADYQDVVLPTDRPEAVQAICRFLRTHAHKWDRALFANIPAESSTLRLFRQYGAGLGLHVVDRARTSCPVLRLNGHEDATRHLIGKYSVRRPLNWFSRRGPLRFRHLTTLAEIEEMLPRFFDQHSRRWRTAGKSSLFDDARQRAFYCALAQNAHAAAWLSFSVLELRDEPIAFHFGFDYLGGVTWYKPSFEPRYAEHSPGLLLIRQLIEDSLQRSRQELDFSIGDEPFKKRFANHQRSNIDIAVYHSRFSYETALALLFARRRAGAWWRAMRKQVSFAPRERD
jgi:CelD/BcsL family acetyltransferase involved in cellulose biosynthesis